MAGFDPKYGRWLEGPSPDYRTAEGLRELLAAVMRAEGDFVASDYVERARGTDSFWKRRQLMVRLRVLRRALIDYLSELEREAL